MRRAMAVFFAGLLGVPASGTVTAGDTVAVDVYLDPDSALFNLIYGAKALTTEIFARIGVELVWHNGPPRTSQAGLRSDRRPAIGISWDDAPAWAGTTVLAAAHPYGSPDTAITLYEDRLIEYLRAHKDEQEVVLAYVLAHELAHVMQGIDRHSASGILKAQWTRDDCDLMRAGKLTFTPEDIELIRNGLLQRPSATTATMAG